MIQKMIATVIEIGAPHAVQSGESAQHREMSHNKGMRTTLTSGPAAMLHKRRTWPRWRVDIGHAAERPEHDPVRSSSNLAASQGVSELMHQNDQEQRQILQHVPGDGGIAALPALDFVDCDYRNQDQCRNTSIPENRNRRIDPWPERMCAVYCIERAGVRAEIQWTVGHFERKTWQ